MKFLRLLPFGFLTLAAVLIYPFLLPFLLTGVGIWCIVKTTQTVREIGLHW